MISFHEYNEKGSFIITSEKKCARNTIVNPISLETSKCKLGWVAPQVQLSGRLTVEWVNFIEIAYGIYILNYYNQIYYKEEILNHKVIAPYCNLQPMFGV